MLCGGLTAPGEWGGGGGRPTQMIPPMLVHSVSRIQELKQSKGCTVAVQFFGTGEYGCAFSLLLLFLVNWDPSGLQA